MARLKAQLSLLQGLSLLTTSLLGTGIFVIPAIVASHAGATSLLAWPLLIALILPIAFTFALLGRRYPHAGGPSHLARQAFGKRAEKLTALLFLSVLPVGLPAALNMASGFWLSLYELSHIERMFIELATIAIMLGLGLAGARVSGQVQSVIAVAIVLTILGLAVIGKVNSNDITFPANQTNWSNLAPALSVMFWCFVGIEAFSHMGEEFTHPQRDFPIALVLGVILAGAVYWLCSVLVLKFASYGDALSNSRSLPILVDTLLGPRAVWLAAPLGYLACFASINIYLQGFARLLWSLADEGTLAKPLAHLSTNKVPTTALIVVSAVCMLCAAAAHLLQLPLEQLIRYANGNFVLIYLLCMVAGVRLLGGPAKWLALCSSLLCLLVLVSLGQQCLYVLIICALFGVTQLRWRVLFTFNKRSAL